MKPEVSILINNYNKYKHIEKCIQSCLKQTFLNFEIIIFDDNSIDKSKNILEKYKKNKKIKIIYNKKKISSYTSFNQMNAIKLSLRQALGNYIFLLDSDDFFEPKKIQNILKIFKSKKVNYIQDKYYLYNFNKKIKKDIRKKNFPTYWDTIYPTSCMCFKKEYLNLVMKKIYFSKARFKYVTFDLRCQIFNKYFQNRALNVNDYLTCYRINTLNYSKNYLKFNFKWWTRRLQAIKFTKALFKQERKAFLYNVDFFITNIIFLIKKNKKNVI